MSQSRKRSAWESALVTSIGVAYAIPVNYLFIQNVKGDPLFRATALTVLFTVLGFVMKYAFRRLFNWIDERYPTGMS